jgi:hypothetical protein
LVQHRSTIHVRIAAAVEEVVAVVAMVADVQVVEDPVETEAMAVDPEAQGLAAMVNVQVRQDQAAIDPMVPDQREAVQTDPLRPVYPG